MPVVVINRTEVVKRLSEKLVKDVDVAIIFINERIKEATALPLSITLHNCSQTLAAILEARLKEAGWRVKLVTSDEKNVYTFEVE